MIEVRIVQDMIERAIKRIRAAKGRGWRYELEDIGRQLQQHEDSNTHRAESVASESKAWDK